MNGVLAQVEGAVAADERAEYLRSKAPQQILDAPVAAQISAPDSCRMGQTSTALCEAKGYSAAISKARSSLSTSSRKKLETNSFASMYGPSVTAGTPSRTRTVLAVSSSPSP